MISLLLTYAVNILLRNFIQYIYFLPNLISYNSMEVCNSVMIFIRLINCRLSSNWYITWHWKTLYISVLAVLHINKN